MTKPVKEYIKNNLPYYGKIITKGRFSGVKAKAWAILSDFVRCRDFYRYGTCVSSGQKIRHWKDGDAGHYISMGGHGALVGFCEMNVHLQGANENRQASAHSGAYYRDELVRRYGEGLLKELDEMKNGTVKADDVYFIGRIEYIYGLFQELKKEFPFGDFPSYI